MKKLEVIKIGGKVIDQPEQLGKVLNAFSKIRGPKILIHGGGSKASEMERTLGLTPKMVDGRRVTSSEALEVVTMVYAGLINKTIVAQLQSFGCNALGLSGPDGNSILASKRPVNPIDFGFVGDVKQVNATFVETLLQSGITPVFSAITHDGKGQLLNTNADTMASVIASAFALIYEVHLTLAFEKEGVLDDSGNVIDKIDKNYFHTLVKNGTIKEGMIPKLTNAFNALTNGVKKVKLTSSENISNTNQVFTNVTLS
ncbi:MAG: acetylglutamate kinase [Cyclobacteriaceae bacterium]|nr:acetylglutamate kinase [Cyclobacteriaceae bacterium]